MKWTDFYVALVGILFIPSTFAQNVRSQGVSDSDLQAKIEVAKVQAKAKRLAAEILADKAEEELEQKQIARSRRYAGEALALQEEILRHMQSQQPKDSGRLDTVPGTGVREKRSRPTPLPRIPIQY